VENAELSQVRALVEGRVQGVGFRYFVRQAAAEIGISGWVRNLSDGRVELMAEGKRQDCDRLLSLVNQGPNMSVVSAVHTTWREPSEMEKGFRIKPTAKSPD